MVTKAVTPASWKVTVAGAFQLLDEGLQREASDGNVEAVREALLAVGRRLDAQQLQTRPARAYDRHVAAGLLRSARAHIQEAGRLVAQVEAMPAHHTIAQRAGRKRGRPASAESRFIRVLRRLESDGLVARRALARYVVQAAESCSTAVQDVVFRDWPKAERIAHLEDRIRPERSGGKTPRKTK